MYAFLFHTPPYVTTKELVDIFDKKHLPHDIIKKIMHYHHINETHRLMVHSSQENFKKYFLSSSLEKKHYRSELINKADSDVSMLLLKSAG